MAADVIETPREFPVAANITIDGLAFRPTLQVTDSLFEISAPGFDGATVRIRHDGRVWVDRQRAHER